METSNLRCTNTNTINQKLKVQTFVNEYHYYTT